MKVLVFQHINCEHPGSLRGLLEQDGIEYTAVELDEGDEIPDLENFDVLWVMGGPMDVWDVEANPWLVEEKKAIRTWVRDLKKPYLGLCLGHQLLADALGGTCGPLSPGEVGILDVELTDEGRAEPLFEGLPTTIKCVQWHSVQVAQPPEDAIILAKSDRCAVQAMRIGTNAWSMQYHVEVEPDTVDNWPKIPEYAAALKIALGDEGIDILTSDSEKYMDDFLSSSKILYDNFMTQIR